MIALKSFCRTWSKWYLMQCKYCTRRTTWYHMPGTTSPREFKNRGVQQSDILVPGTRVLVRRTILVPTFEGFSFVDPESGFRAELISTLLDEELTTSR